MKLEEKMRGIYKMRKRVHGRIPPAPRESRRCARLARRVGEIPARRRWGLRMVLGAQPPRPQGAWARVGAGQCRGDHEMWSQGAGSKVPCATALPTPDPVGLQAPDREPGRCCKCWGSGWRGCQPPQGTLSLLWHAGWLPVGGFRGLMGILKNGVQDGVEVATEPGCSGESCPLFPALVSST